MALSPQEKNFLRPIYQRLDDAPLLPGDHLYQPVYELPGCEDPVSHIERHIEWSDAESLQMFSGFRGSGKTTELLRLKERLEKQGYAVVYADAMEYIPPSDPVDITDLLIVLAGAFSDGLKGELGIDVAEDSYWARLKNFLLRTEVSVSEATVKTEFKSPGEDILGSLKTGLDLKLALKSAPTFRQRMQHLLANRVGELKREVDEFFEYGVQRIRAARGNDDLRVVFIFDQLEQLRGSRFNEEAVIRSVLDIFADHFRKLELPYVHVVYTVPPWLKFALPNLGTLHLLPSVRQWNNDGVRSECQPGCDALRELIVKRFGVAEFERVFGPRGADGRNALAERLLGVCGGHFRDLLRLFRGTLLAATSLPVSEQAVESAIASVRRGFLPIPIDDAKWLEKIAHQRAAALPSGAAETVSRLTRFLDTHLVLYFINGEEWYDIHPLIRDEVARITQLDAAPETS
jgi:hypothetical protein